MKRKNFKLLEAIANSGLRQVDLVRQAGLSSESRLSRIINYLVVPTEEEVRQICEVLKVDGSILEARK